MAMVVPVLLPVAVPRFLTNAMPARASDAARPNRRASASVAAARGARSLRESTVIAPEGKCRPPPGVSADAVAGLRAHFPAPPSRSPDARRRGRAPGRVRRGSPGAVPKAAPRGRRVGKRRTDSPTCWGAAGWRWWCYGENADGINGEFGAVTPVTFL